MCLAPELADDGAGRPIGAKLVHARHFQRTRQPYASPVDAALHRTYRATGYVRRLFIGISFGADQDECLTLVDGECVECGGELPWSAAANSIMSTWLGWFGLTHLISAILPVSSTSRRDLRYCE